jgi:hypothetical protein
MRHARGAIKPVPPVPHPLQQTGMARAVPMRIEPKTFFANERTFLAWLHMSITIGSIAAAMLGFAGSGSADGAQVRRSQRALPPLPLARCRHASTAAL